VRRERTLASKDVRAAGFAGPGKDRGVEGVQSRARLAKTLRARGVRVETVF
jgi:hypothetical protein